MKSITKAQRDCFEASESGSYRGWDCEIVRETRNKNNVGKLGPYCQIIGPGETRNRVAVEFVRVNVGENFNQMPAGFVKIS